MTRVVKRFINWAYEQELKNPIDANKLEDDTNFLVSNIENSLDICGDNITQSSINLGSSSPINSVVNTDENCLISAGEFVALASGISCIDNGSSVDEGIVRLKTDGWDMLEKTLDNYETLPTMFKINFYAPFTLSQDFIIGNLRQEIIELSIGSKVFSFRVARLPVEASENFESGFRETRPSFMKGDLVELVYHSGAWYCSSSLLGGALYPCFRDDITPAGYADYQEFLDSCGMYNTDKYRYFLSMTKKYLGSGYDVFGKQLKQMFPRHDHSSVDKTYGKVAAAGNSDPVSGISNKYIGSVAKGNFTIGVDIKPRTLNTRYLMSIFCL